MSRIILLCGLPALLAACAADSVSHTRWAQAQMACANVGIAPGSGLFSQCAADLDHSVWDQQNVFER